MTEDEKLENGTAVGGSRLQRLVSELRNRLVLPNDAEICDEEILRVTDGTLLRASAELHLACVDLDSAAKKEIAPIAAALKKAKAALTR